MIIQIFNESEKGVRCHSKTVLYDPEIVPFDFKIVRYDVDIIHSDPENTVNGCSTFSIDKKTNGHKHIAGTRSSQNISLPAVMSVTLAILQKRSRAMAGNSRDNQFTKSRGPLKQCSGSRSFQTPILITNSRFFHCDIHEPQKKPRFL
jgi:hypothetical protein